MRDGVKLAVCKRGLVDAYHNIVETSPKGELRRISIAGRLKTVEEHATLLEERPQLHGHGDEEGLNTKLENGSVVSGGCGLNFGEFRDVSPRSSSIFESSERQRCKTYAEVLRSYEELQSQIERLEEAKNKVLSYTPGSLVENVGGLSSSTYVVPQTTSLLLIGPKGSGKSSLINKISRFLDNDVFGSERAQVSRIYIYISSLIPYNLLSGDGTYFLHEYKIPRGSSSFCLYDTRSLSDDPSENVKMTQGWMTKGVRHGELVRRQSDSEELKARLRCKARWSCSPGWVRPVNFVIFVVNGLSVLESMDGGDETKNWYLQLIATTFNNPLLSFKDDKPVVVVTHGDLLSLSERVRIRVYLGELLGVPPTRQIYDIPENDDAATTLTIINMLNYCLERADRNLPGQDVEIKHMFGLAIRLIWKNDVQKIIRAMCLTFVMAGLLIMACQTYGSRSHRPRPPPIDLSMKVDWRAIRHMWLGDE
ncbi:hypothetical protein BUALT_Bualt13G0116400 [Buddleja alternifolia]|uniref:Uncharacterized protein n=1 Tax=Buddleja alternifolia TaxID=168488 RepID=A0AAV6WNQ2_9LAMI|nr:hypothetical protein BUALT_Bualt13G0116400 [Buddleja alternifolia]